MVYGTGTRSYNRSKERRQMKQECKQATDEFIPKTDSVELLVACNCLYKPFPHLGHSELHNNDHDWRPRK